MCGEHRKRFVAATDSEGSSPHVRGTHGFGFGGGDLIGIIPACAGNTAFTRHSCRIERDHPRMCGEHSTSKSPPLVVSGSSPHVRGTHAVGASDGTVLGIIPACAGNTVIVRFDDFRSGDHPRMCGEHFRTATHTASRQGSSPHVRGTPSTIPARKKRNGIIPACAGNTACSSFPRLSSWDHPRMCGEHLTVVPSPGSAPGSSPHVRGTPLCVSFRGVPVGIIPACAGNTGLRL